MIRRALVSLALACAALAAARAEPAAPLPPAEKQSLDAFATAHGTCQEWSDGCVVCERQAGAAYACSTPGIACQPAALMCQNPKEAPKPEVSTPESAH